MECLKRVSPRQWQETSELRQFYDDLANKPYCTNEKGTIFIRGKKHAIKHRFIQPNHPRVIKWLVFDIDHPEALFTFIDTGLPKPQVIIKNPKNGHAHYAYRLTTPVGIGGNSSTRAESYLKAVRDALCEALGADPSYSGNLIKNPCYIRDNAPTPKKVHWLNNNEDEGNRDEHETYLTGAKPSYTLTELADYLDLEPLYPETKQKPANDTEYGRNCSLFEELRHLAYQCECKSFDAIESYLKPIAEKKNQQFDVPLPLNEVKHIVRSIARYCARMDFTASHKAFSKRQATRGARGGQAKGRSYEEKRQQAKELYKQGLNKSEIARKLDVSRRSIINWIKSEGCENSHNQIIAAPDAGMKVGMSRPLPRGVASFLFSFATLCSVISSVPAPAAIIRNFTCLARISVFRPPPEVSKHRVATVVLDRGHYSNFCPFVITATLKDEYSNNASLLLSSQ